MSLSQLLLKVRENLERLSEITPQDDPPAYLYEVLPEKQDSDLQLEQIAVLEILDRLGKIVPSPDPEPYRYEIKVN